MYLHVYNLSVSVCVCVCACVRACVRVSKHADSLDEHQQCSHGNRPRIRNSLACMLLEKIPIKQVASQH